MVGFIIICQREKHIGYNKKAKVITNKTSSDPSYFKDQYPSKSDSSSDTDTEITEATASH